ncbi:universal stress protein UspA [Haloarcula taiwanensis]|uniref:Universal stress protein UspA n=1 Tax=Haloarcula taiwanensis TaxID=1932004 RepID=A0A2H5A1C4_9EURY|nr:MULTISPECIES: universal stress protein [Haloarcula]AUG48511.1 universal stress protein UspA [Haloarcula taiwanensis]RLM40362.1 universal stress protein [Haloarcula sp. Atlit-120R]RLM48382.1 universal stress protein [Haloarcula sp. Atlit-47R]RLM96738.1 universal stress protein [Haloarcula sp. Atlit-7R]
MYNDILFPTDGSDGADEALAHALELAETHDSTIHVLSVVDSTYLGSAAAEATTIESLQEQTEQVIDETVDNIADHGVPVVAEHRMGDPYEEIIDYAETADIDMIVMGTHGRSGLDRFLLGSVTEKVVRTADAPVLTVRLPDDT